MANQPPTLAQRGGATYNWPTLPARSGRWPMPGDRGKHTYTLPAATNAGWTSGSLGWITRCAFSHLLHLPHHARLDRARVLPRPLHMRRISPRLGLTERYEPCGRVYGPGAHTTGESPYPHDFALRRACVRTGRVGMTSALGLVYHTSRVTVTHKPRCAQPPPLELAPRALLGSCSLGPPARPCVFSVP